MLVRIARSFALILALSCVVGACYAQSAPSAEQLHSLAQAQRWDELVRLLAPIPNRSADLDFDYGEALAQSGKLPEAARAFEEGWKQAPADARFPTELAGAAFKQKQNARTARLLRSALKLSPGDAYVSDFLGTVYFLDGNIEAALKYWNRAGKPQVVEIRSDPQPKVSLVLLDRAFAFAPASRLQLQQYLDSEARLRGMGIFPQFQIGLNARSDGRFDTVLRARERNGLGGGPWEDVFLFLRGIPFQQVSPSYFNFRNRAINFDSMLRWDAQKRRVWAEISGPMQHAARFRWEMTTDLRNENWAIRNGFTGPAPVLSSFNLRTARASIGVASYASERLEWRAGVEISHRDLRNVNSGGLLTAQMLAPGYALKQQAEATVTAWRVPEHRFTMHANGANDVARLWAANSSSFDRLQGGVDWRWLPMAKGNDYATAQTVRAGAIFGEAPFDELFILGLERDNDLPMRAHIGTRDGRKGSAPLGSQYLLENWELDKNLYGNGLLALTVGPFLDIGKMNDAGAELGSHKWLFDTGAQLKLHVLGVGLGLSYGKDLRTGNNAFYLRLLER